MASGLINVDRGLLNHTIFRPKKFSKAEAWIWLLCEARWKDQRKDIGGKTVTIKRGQVPHSLRFMASAWGWSKGGTERFVNRLKTEAMIGTISVGGQNILTICNYDTYQSYEKYREEKFGTVNGTELGQSWDDVGTELGQTRTPDTPETPEESVKGPTKKAEETHAKPKRRRKRGTETPLPDDWEPDEKGREYARKHWGKAGRQDIDIASQVEKFHNHHRSRDNRMVSWSAAWRTWVGNAPGFTPRLQQSNGGGPGGKNRSASEQMSDSIERVVARRARSRGEQVIGRDERDSGREDFAEGDGPIVELFPNGQGQFGE